MGYKQNEDGSMEPLKIHTVVISTQHAEPGKALRSKECEGYKGPEMTAPTTEMMNKHIEKDVIVKCLEEIKLKNGKPAVSLYGDHTHLHINPSGKFIIGGPPLTPEAITQIVKIAFDCRPGAIAKSLQLREPKYQLTAAYGHFGREAYTENGMKYFEWENATDLSKYKAMTPASVEAELKKSY